MRRPTDEEIRAVEVRVEQAESDFKTAKVRTSTALLDFIVHPVTLLGVALAAGGVAYKIFKRKPKAPVKFEWPWNRNQVSPETKQVAQTSLLSLVLAIGIRYLIQSLPSIGFRLLGHSLRKRGAFSRGVPTPGSSTTLH